MFYALEEVLRVELVHLPSLEDGGFLLLISCVILAWHCLEKSLFRRSTIS